MNIEEKLDIIIEKQNEHSVILAVNTFHLADHIRRTELLEDRIDPIEKSYTEVNGMFKLIAGVSVIATIIDVIFHLVHHV
jgi:hypothetical protein